MDNRIYVDFMTKTYHDFVKTHTTSSQKFAGRVKGVYEKQTGAKNCACQGAGKGWTHPGMGLAASGRRSMELDQLLAQCGVAIVGDDESKKAQEMGTANGATKAEKGAAVNGSAKAGESAAVNGSAKAGESAAVNGSAKAGESAAVNGSAKSQGSEEAHCGCDTQMEDIYEKMELICGCGTDCCQSQETSVQDMTLEEYKKYIYDKIASIPMHPSQSKNSVSIHITDAGFEAMKNDPEYEAWVLDTIRRDFSFQDPWGNVGGGRYIVHTFGATKEEYRGYSWSKPDRNASRRRKLEKSFWQRRRERQKKLQKKYVEEQMKKRALIRRIQQQLFIEKNISWAAAGYEAKKIVH